MPIDFTHRIDELMTETEIVVERHERNSLEANHNYLQNTFVANQ